MVYVRITDGMLVFLEFGVNAETIPVVGLGTLVITESVHIDVMSRVYVYGMLVT